MDWSHSHKLKIMDSKPVSDVTFSRCFILLCCAYCMTVSCCDGLKPKQHFTYKSTSFVNNTEHTQCKASLVLFSFEHKKHVGSVIKYCTQREKKKTYLNQMPFHIMFILTGLQALLMLHQSLVCSILSLLKVLEFLKFVCPGAWACVFPRSEHTRHSKCLQ